MLSKLSPIATLSQALECTRGYAVKLRHQSRYSALLKDSLAMIETDLWRIFLIKDQSAVQQALRQGAKLLGLFGVQGQRIPASSEVG
jgi:hypothetical protein